MNPGDSTVTSTAEPSSTCRASPKDSTKALAAPYTERMGVGSVSGGACDEEDMSASARDHALAEDLGQFGKSHDVELKHRAKMIGGLIDECAVQADRGIVDENVHLDVPLIEPTQKRRRAVRFGEVDGFHEHFHPVLA